MKINPDEIFDSTSFNIDRDPHIQLNEEICRRCPQRACTNCCPARCYNWDEEAQKMTFVHDGCLECGTCYVVCGQDAFTRWRYPRGGFGVAYRMT
ncbi:ferredoxin family protein [Desulfuromonas thiophila]|uniref:ferredoxin family protein n=1 Tax=Desulfuromonas thiophila TaxID=57664 RepID=UPI0029F4FBFC|nr:ferredoxin family protein [Desulfuromonas thiophila]